MNIRQLGAELFQRTNGQTDIHYEAFFFAILRTRL
jgi:hypothetical protein